MKGLQFEPDIGPWRAKCGQWEYLVHGPDWDGACDAHAHGPKVKRLVLAEDVSFAAAIAACELHACGFDTEIDKLVVKCQADMDAEDKEIESHSITGVEG